MGGRSARPGPRLIRRYENRKLYDAAARRYVTLDDVAAMIAAGEEVQVVERASGEDITTTVFAQVIFEGIKQRNADIPRHVLARLIRLGLRPAASALDWSAPRDAASHAREEAERIVSDLVTRGRLSLEEALTLRQEIAESIRRIAADAQHGVEQRVRGLLERPDAQGGGVHPALSGLRERLLDVESWIEAAPAAPSRRRPGPRRPRRSRN